MKPYYNHGGITIYCGDCREFITDAMQSGMGPAFLVTDPPYGINYNSGWEGSIPRSIQGDKDPSLRDWVVAAWNGGPALVFGSWKIPRPAATHTRLIWDTKGALGMGDLSVPWKPSDQEIYVLGTGFVGRRDSNVLRYAPVQSMARNGRLHPHEKPVSLMRALIEKCPPEALIFDPFMGSGSTLLAAKQCGRRAIGIEIDERYCELAVRRFDQATIFDGMEDAA